MFNCLKIEMVIDLGNEQVEAIAVSGYPCDRKATLKQLEE